MSKYSIEDGYLKQSEVTYEGIVFNTFGGLSSIIKKGIILDLGCSIGVTTQELSNTFKDSNIIGIDYNLDSIDVAQFRRRKGIFIVGDGFYAPFKDNFFDAVFLMNNLVIATDEMKKELAMKRFNQVGALVKQEGYLLISANIDHIILQKKGINFFELRRSFNNYENSQKRLELILESLGI